MADTKISALTAATTPLAGTEVLPIVQSGVTKQVSVANLTAGRAVSMLSGTVGTSPGAVTAPTNADDLVVQNNAAAGITILSPDANAGRIHFGTVSNNSNVTLYGQYNYGFDLYLSGSMVLHADTSTKDITWSLGNLVQGTAAKGINFTANTGAAGKTSQLLNWYEEGTFTAGIAFGGGTTGITYGAQYGFYTRIGRQVFVNGYVALTNKGSSTGNATITGLPYTSKNASGNYGPGSLLPYSITFSGQMFAAVTTNAATATLYQETTAGVRSNLDNTNFVNTSEIIFSFTYIV